VAVVPGEAAKIRRNLHLHYMQPLPNPKKGPILVSKNTLSTPLSVLIKWCCVAPDT